MIEILSAIARQYTWIRSLGIAAGLLSGSVLVYSLLGSGASDLYLIPSLIVVIWSLLLVVLSVTFPDLPAKPTPDQKILRRIRLRLKRLTFYAIGIVFIVLSLATMYLSFKLFGVWRAEYHA